MKQIILPKFFLTIFSLVLLFGSDAFAQSRTEEWFVADRTADCTGVAPQKCLVVRRTDSTDWSYFYGSIRGFRFRDGFTQKIRVLITPRRNAPPDASAFEYRLLRTVSRSRTDGNTLEEALRQMQNQKPLALGGEQWTIVEIEGKPLKAAATMRFDEKERRFGAKICNGMGGTYEQKGSSLKFSNVIGTMMACMEPIQTTEIRFRAVIEKITRGERQGDTLVLFGGNTPVLKLSAAAATDINKPLETTKWAVLEIEGEKIAAKGQVPFLQLDKEKMMYSGFSGCNQIFGKYETRGSRLDFSGGGMTRRACLDPEAQRIERRMTAALGMIDRYEIKNGVLSLYDGDKILLKLMSPARN